MDMEIVGGIWARVRDTEVLQTCLKAAWSLSQRSGRTAWRGACLRGCRLLFVLTEEQNHIGNFVMREIEE